MSGNYRFPIISRSSFSWYLQIVDQQKASTDRFLKPNCRCGIPPYLRSTVCCADFPFVAILKLKKGHVTAGMFNRTVTTTDEFFEIYLLSETHRTKIQVAEFKDLEKAKSFAKEFATVAERKLTTYSPQISSSSRRRR